jgi:hypothetical protein
MKLEICWFVPAEHRNNEEPLDSFLLVFACTRSESVQCKLLKSMEFPVSMPWPAVRGDCDALCQANMHSFPSTYPYHTFIPLISLTLSLRLLRPRPPLGARTAPAPRRRVRCSPPLHRQECAGHPGMSTGMTQRRWKLVDCRKLATCRQACTRTRPGLSSSRPRAMAVNGCALRLSVLPRPLPEA